MTQQTLQIKETNEGELYFELPDELLERLGWQEGDEIKFVEKNGGFMIKRTRYENVELELEEDELFEYMKSAHEQNMSFNDWVEHAIREVIDGLKNEEQD